MKTTGGAPRGHCACWPQGLLVLVDEGTELCWKNVTEPIILKSGR
jgi:hypothetical protein